MKEVCDVLSTSEFPYVLLTWLQAYMQGQFDPEYKAIVKSVSAILFMSTPHRGTNLAETLNRILQVSFVSAPRQYINDLVKNSATIQKINEQFRHLAPNLSIVSFYEAKPTAIGFSSNRIVCRLSLSLLHNLTTLVDGIREGFICSRISWRGIKTTRRRPSQRVQIRQCSRPKLCYCAELLEISYEQIVHTTKPESIYRV